MYRATPFWLVEFLLRNQLLTLWEFPCILFVIFPLLLSIIFVFNFCQVDYYVSRRVSPWVYPAWDSLCFLHLGGYFLSHVREVFDYNLFKYFLGSFLSSLSGTPIMQMLLRLMLSQRSLRLSSFLFIFSLFCSMAVNSTILSSRSLICSYASVILLLIPASLFFISVIVLFICLFVL